MKNKFKETKEELYEKNAENMALKVKSTVLGALPLVCGFLDNQAIESKKVRVVQ